MKENEKRTDRYLYSEKFQKFVK